MPSRKAARVTADVRARAQFVFGGAVTAVGRNNLDGVPDEPSMAIVHVEQVMLAPPQVGDLMGHDVTVALADGPALHEGEHAIFYAAAWHYGSTVGVAELGREMSDPTAAAARAPAIADDVVGARLREVDRAVGERLARAELVVAGRVLRVEDVETVELHLEGAGWRKAEVWISETLKGTPPDELWIVFPYRNKEFADAPPCVEDQVGIWLLSERSSDPRGWVALDPQDYHAMSSLERIHLLVGTVR